MNAAAIILAAGRGSRMGDATQKKPKCLAKLAGKSLIDWQLMALHQAGIEQILVVRGYKGSAVQGEFVTVENSHFATTNMLYSLLCAKTFVREFFPSGGERLIISYADIVYHSEHIKKLLTAKSEIAITFDSAWEDLWNLRFTDPLSDAESFRQKDGFLCEIGTKPETLAEIQGQYMGLLALDASGWKSLLKICDALGEKFKTMDMTTFLRTALLQNISIAAVEVEGRWCEVDSQKDIKKYEEALKKGNWKHDWR